MNRMTPWSFAKNKRHMLYLIILSIMIMVALSACGSPAPPMTPGADNHENSEYVAPEIELDGATPFTTTQTIHVDDDRLLTLRLNGRQDSDGRYGIVSVDVLDGDTLLQAISIREVFEQIEGYEGQSWTYCWDESGNLFAEDLNFDGAEDIRLMAGAGVVNISYLCWLWNPETEQFLFSFKLLGYDVLIDQEAQQLVTETRGGWGNYYTDFYAYDDNGNLQHVKQIHQDYTAEGATEDQPITKVYTFTPPSDAITYIGVYPTDPEPGDGDQESYLPVSYTKGGVQMMTGGMGPHSILLAEDFFAEAPAAEDLRMTDVSVMYAAESGIRSVACSGDWELFPTEVTYLQYTEDNQPQRTEWKDYFQVRLAELPTDSPVVISEAWLFDWNGAEAAVVTASNVSVTGGRELLTQQDDYAQPVVPSNNASALYTMSALFTAGNEPVELYREYQEVSKGLGISYLPPTGAFMQFLSTVQTDRDGNLILCPIFCDHGGELSIRNFRYRPGFLLCDIDGDGVAELIEWINKSSSVMCTCLVYQVEDEMPQSVCSIVAN